jgi:predicted Rossmann fold nucleotide-binding protein DprA/Smf involved in DNA uptake
VSLTYVDKAARAFLAGTPYRYPVQAIEAGARTVEEWCEVLNNVRDTLASPPVPQPAKAPHKATRHDDARYQRLIERLSERPASIEELMRASGYSRQGVRNVLEEEGALLLKRGARDFVYVLDDVGLAA